MGNIVSLQLLLLIVLPSFMYFDSSKLVSCHEYDDLSISRIEIEKKALLEFKNSLLDPSGRLSSWKSSEDCRRWRGVSCSTKAKHVIKLDLHNSVLGGNISSSLLYLKYLSYLDLSWNNFNEIRIPQFFGSLKNLRYLNLSGASFYVSIPQSLGNLSKLQYLDLSLYNSDESIQNDLYWVPGLSSLKHVDLTYVNLNGTAPYWLQIFNTIPSLLELHLSKCQLTKLPPLLQHVNFTSLSILDLSLNGFDSTIPQWLFNISSLKQLDLSVNRLRVMIPDTFSKLSALETLSLSAKNAIEGKLPGSLGKLCNLKVLLVQWMNITGDITYFIQSLSECSNNSLEMLHLGYNNLNGNVPKSIGFLKNLQSLVLQSNSFTGSIPETIGRLSSLKNLDLSGNRFEGIILESHLVNLSSLEELKLGIAFPSNISLSQH